MNVFYLDQNPATSAQLHCDKHVVKMCTEYAQLLSTAHRVLDGVPYFEENNGKKVKRWKLWDNSDLYLYKATHINHPSAVWARASNENYEWLTLHWIYLLEEYKYRYGKDHAAGKLRFALMNIPRLIPLAITWSDPPPAMPKECIVYDEYGYEDVVASYRNYYVLKKNHFAKWTNREIPEWYSQGVLNLMVSENEAMGLYD